MITIEGVEKIKEKMMDEANSEYERIVSEAKKKASEIAENNKKKVEGFITSEKEKVASEVHLFTSKEIASFEMSKRKDFMERRENIINEIIDEAVSTINKKKEYENFIEKNLKEYTALLGKKVEVLCSSKDIDLVKKMISKLNLDANVEEASIKGGFILEGSDKRIDMSLESILEEKRSTVRQKVVEALG